MTKSITERILIFQRGVMVLVIGLVIVGCNKSKDVGPSTLGYDFYPIEVGAYRIYDVEEINYLIIGFDTANYQLKESIFDSLVSGDQITYLLRREVRENEQAAWVSDSLWTVTRRDNNLSVVENNVPFIKLTFPVKAGKEWDGNSLNSRVANSYLYAGLTEPIIDSLSTDDHIRVIIDDIEENVTGVDLKSEVYARGIGLVEKDFLTQKRCTASDCGEDLGEVIAGRSLKQHLIEVGHEE